MEELVKTFHIDWKLMLAQLVNFGIVLFVLYKFAYGPILKTLNERSAKIEKGLKDAEDSSRKLVEIEKEQKEILKKAREDAQALLMKAEQQAEKVKTEIAAEAKTQVERMMADAEKKIEEEKGKMLSEAKKEVAELVVLATGKVIADKIDGSKDKELIAKALE